MNRTPEQWARIAPKAFLDGSTTQASNVIAMMQTDIASLAVQRDTRQRRMVAWAHEAFGHGQGASVQQRALRLLEEAIEAYQAAGCPLPLAHKLLDFVYSRPAGELDREIGQVGLCLLVFAGAAAVSADACEANEVARIALKPPSHYTARNVLKNAAGFLIEEQP